MKKVLCLLLLIAVIVTILIFTVYPKTHSYELKMSENEITKIDIVETKENGSRVIIKELSLESDIIQRLKEIIFFKTTPPNYSIAGKGLLITYSDGSSELIQYNCNVYFKNDEDFFSNESCKRDIFLNLLNEYS